MKEYNWSSKNIFFFINELKNNHSILRALQHLVIKKHVKISGNCLDLGAKNINQPYYEFIEKEINTKLNFNDLYHKGDNIMQFDLNKKFPVEDNTYDDIIMFNTLEHVYDTDNILNQSFRVLKKNGNLYGLVPFLFRYHADPHDYWRFTHEAIKKKLEDIGFNDILVEIHGVGIFTIINSFFIPLIKYKFIKFFFIRCGIFLDNIYFKRKKKHIHNLYLGIFFKCKKNY